jgi:hypothetical protein
MNSVGGNQVRVSMSSLFGSAYGRGPLSVFSMASYPLPLATLTHAPRVGQLGWQSPRQKDSKLDGVDGQPAVGPPR